MTVPPKTSPSTPLPPQASPPMNLDDTEVAQESLSPMPLLHTAPPRLLISGLSGGSGKTTVSLGLARYFTSTACYGLSTSIPADTMPLRPLEHPWATTLGLLHAPRPVQTFKKGPDYIDAAWLGLAARCITKTLDPYFSSPEDLRRQFIEGCSNASLALVEGNRGIYDGVDSHGTCSSAHLAKTLETPVLLVVDCTKMTRTVAALVLGCTQFDKNVTIGGVILNRLGTTRQEKIIREALAQYTDVPVLGALPRLQEPLLPERHMGLAAIEADSSEKLDALCRFIADHTDIQSIWHLANTPLAPRGNEHSASQLSQNKVDLAQRAAMPAPASPKASDEVASKASGPVIGYVYDDAVWFYYVENLMALHSAGARLKRLSLFDAQGWESLDGLYVGGGQLEGHAARLSASPQLALLRTLSDKGLPIYMEGSSLAIACRQMIVQETVYPMAGIFDAVTTLRSRPQGLGYTRAVTTRQTPFFDKGESIVGHQFNFFQFEAAPLPMTFMHLSKGRGLFATDSQDSARSQHDGLMHENTCASLTHIFAPAMQRWAPRFVAQCLENKRHSA